MESSLEVAVRRKILGWLSAFAAVVAASYAAAAMVMAGLGYGTPPWWSWQYSAVVAFIIFVVIVSRKLRSQAQEIEQFKNAQPEISVTPVLVNNRAILEVRNDGGMADFVAKGRVIGGVPGPELFTMYWEAIPDGRCKIKRGEIAAILVGEREIGIGPRGETFLTGGMVLFKMGASGEQTYPVHTFVNQTNMATSLMDSTRMVSMCVVEVTITSSPALKDRFEEKRFRFSNDGETPSFAALSSSGA